MSLLILLLLLCMPAVYADDLKSSSAVPVSSVLVKAQEAAGNNQWAIAEDLYRQAKIISIEQDNTEQTLDILFSLLMVYQQQFDGVSAFQTAAEIEQLAVTLSDSFSLTRSYRLLGIAYQALANNELARDYFSVAVESARDLKNPVLLASLLNELGYADVLVADYRSAVASFNESFTLARSENDQNLMLQAQINLLRASIALGDKQIIEQEFNVLEALLDAVPDSKTLIDKIISVGTLYRTAQIKLELTNQYRKTAYLKYERGLKLARKYQDIQLQSIANGYIGQIYSDEAQYEIATTYTQEAIVLAQKLNNLDLVYRWTVQLARVYNAGNKTTLALRQYQRAIDILDTLDIVSFTRFERSFNSDVKPVFDEIISLLFQSLSKSKDSEQKQAILEKTIQYVEILRNKELSAFCFGNCKLAYQEKSAVLPEENAILYPIVLDDELHVIVKSRSGVYSQLHNVSRKNVLSKLRQLNEKIQKNSINKDYLEQSTEFYQWLILPFEKIFENDNVTTLAVVPSQALMELPFDILFSDNQFLIEKYSIKLILSANDLDNHNNRKISDTSYILLASTAGKYNGIVENQKQIKLYTNNNLSYLKNDITNIRNNQFLEFTGKLNLANDYRQNTILINDENIPLFSLFNKINNGNPMGLLLISGNKPGEMNNIYFNAHLINANYIIAPMWPYSLEASQLLLSHLNKSLNNENSVEKALQLAKIELINSKTFSSPVNWAGLLVLQH